MPLGWGCGKDAGVAVPSLPGEECKLPRKLICPPYRAARKGWCCGCHSQLFFSYYFFVLFCTKHPKSVAWACWDWPCWWDSQILASPLRTTLTLSQGVLSTVLGPDPPGTLVACAGMNAVILLSLSMYMNCLCHTAQLLLWLSGGRGEEEESEVLF